MPWLDGSHYISALAKPGWFTTCNHIWFSFCLPNVASLFQPCPSYSVLAYCTCIFSQYFMRLLCDHLCSNQGYNQMSKVQNFFSLIVSCLRCSTCARATRTKVYTFIETKSYNSVTVNTTNFVLCTKLTLFCIALCLWLKKLCMYGR